MSIAYCACCEVRRETVAYSWRDVSLACWVSEGFRREGRVVQIRCPAARFHDGGKEREENHRMIDAVNDDVSIHVVYLRPQQTRQTLIRRVFEADKLKKSKQS